MELVYAQFARREDADRAMNSLGKADMLREVSLLFPAPRPSPEEWKNGIPAGSTLGGLVGLVAGMSTVFLPGLGEFAAAGPLAGLLCGSVTGGVVGSLVSLGLSERESESFAQGVANGRVLFSMETAEDLVPEVEKILTRHRAECVSHHMAKGT